MILNWDNRCSLCVSAQWHLETLALSSLSSSSAPPSPLVLRLRCHSNPRARSQKNRLGHVRAHTNFHLAVCSRDSSDSRIYQQITRFIIFLLFQHHLPSSSLHLHPSALSLRACVPAGSDSSSSHLVLGKLGYANNISAQNISATRSSDGGKPWPSYSTEAPAYLYNPWPCCHPPGGVCDSERQQETCRQGPSEKETGYVRARQCIG